MESKYKGIKIRIMRDRPNQFRVDELNKDYPTLDDAEKAIDRYEKRKSKFNRIPIFFKKNHSLITKAEITSVIRYGQIWVSIDGGSREKLGSHVFCCMNNEKNSKVLNQYFKMILEAKIINKKADTLLKGIDNSELEEIIEKATPKK